MSGNNAETPPIVFHVSRMSDQEYAEFQNMPEIAPSGMEPTEWDDFPTEDNPPITLCLQIYPRSDNDDGNGQ